MKLTQRFAMYVCSSSYSCTYCFHKLFFLKKKKTQLEHNHQSQRGNIWKNVVFLSNFTRFECF